MRCPNCGKELYPADWFYDYRTGFWYCDNCGLIFKFEEVRR